MSIPVSNETMHNSARWRRRCAWDRETCTHVIGNAIIEPRHGHYTAVYTCTPGGYYDRLQAHRDDIKTHDTTRRDLNGLY